MGRGEGGTPPPFQAIPWPGAHDAQPKRAPALRGRPGTTPNTGPPGGASNVRVLVVLAAGEVLAPRGAASATSRREPLETRARRTATTLRGPGDPLSWGSALVLSAMQSSPEQTHGEQDRDALDGGTAPPPLQGAQPTPSHCLPDAKCQP